MFSIWERNLIAARSQGNIVELIKYVLVGCTSCPLMSWITSWDRRTTFISLIWSNGCPSRCLITNVVYCTSENPSLMFLWNSFFIRGARICKSHRADLLKECVQVFILNCLHASTSSWVSHDAYLREPWVFDIFVPDESCMIKHIACEVIWFYVWIHN